MIVKTFAIFSTDSIRSVGRQFAEAGNKEWVLPRALYVVIFIMSVGAKVLRVIT